MDPRVEQLRELQFIDDKEIFGILKSSSIMKASLADVSTLYRLRIINWNIQTKIFLSPPPKRRGGTLGGKNSVITLAP